jgi:adenosylcobinamide-phosphate synthase
VIASRVLAAAYLFDWIAGDPEWLPHPVRLMGKCIEQGERSLRRPAQTPAIEFLAGGALTLGVVAASYVGTARAIDWTYKRSRWFGVATETALAWTCFASRSLHDEASAVVAALESEHLALARERLARIVGRDTQYLDTEEVSRAVIETVAESASDGVIAPLLYIAIAGVPLAMAYKAINTLDSMIGHADKQYFYFGKVAARLDDVANLLPARLTALGITAVASVIEDASFCSSITTWLSDGGRHKSPNAGQPESAMAGALRVRLGGTNFYNGEVVAAPLIGKKFSKPSVQQAKQAIQIASAISALGALTALLLRGKRA